MDVCFLLGPFICVDSATDYFDGCISQVWDFAKE